MFVAASTSQADRTEISGLYPFNDLVHGLLGSLIEVALDHTVIFTGRFDELTALEDIM